MQLQVQVGNVLYPLTEGQPLPFKVREGIKVFYAFRYKMPQTTGVEIWASLYSYTLGILNREENAQTKQEITLVKSLEWKDYEGEIDVEIGKIGSGTYGLICELPDHDVEDHIDDCLEVTAPPGIMEMIGPLLMLGLMVLVVSMIAPKIKEG